MMMVTSASGVKAIAQHEGLELETYEDPIGVLTIGYGHTGSEAYPGNKITRKKAMELLKEDLKTAEAIIHKYVKVPLTQPQLDALSSFVLNVGPGAKGVKDGFVRLKNGNTSTILRKLNEGDYFGAADELPKWKNAGGKPFRGLIIRRAAERALFLSGTTIEQPLDSNIEPDAPQKPPIASEKPVQILAGTGVAGTLSIAAETVQPLADYSEYLKILWVILVLAGLWYFIKERKEV